MVFISDIKRKLHESDFTIREKIEIVHALIGSVEQNIDDLRYDVEVAKSVGDDPEARFYENLTSKAIASRMEYLSLIESLFNLRRTSSTEG